MTRGAADRRQYRQGAGAAEEAAVLAGVSPIWGMVADTDRSHSRTAK